MPVGVIVRELALLGYLRRFQGCPTGSAVITPGFKLPARFILHAVGPVYRDGRGGEPELLTSAYDVSFQLALEEPSIRTIAFPAISTGVYGYPKKEAARIAVSRMRAQESAFDRIVACLFDAESTDIYRRLLAP